MHYCQRVEQDSLLERIAYNFVFGFDKLSQLHTVWKVIVLHLVIENIVLGMWSKRPSATSPSLSFGRLPFFISKHVRHIGDPERCAIHHEFTLRTFHYGQSTRLND